MSGTPAWLPPVIPLSGDWATYEAALYRVFRQVFFDPRNRTTFRGKPVFVRTQPLWQGKENGFWHLTHDRSGGSETPDLRRCERLVWAKPLLEAPETDRRVWAEVRDGRERLGIGLPDFSYVLFVSEYPGNYLLRTAYHVERPTRRRQYEQEWLADKR